MKGRELREKLFNIYAANLSEALPGITDTFRCPICLKDFDRSALEDYQTLTLGHIIPNALGGSIRTLECGKCNSVASANDLHEVNMKKFNDWLNMKENAKKLVRITDELSTVSAFASWGPNKELEIRAADWEDPNYKEQSKRMISQLKHHSTSTFTIKLNSRSIPERRVVSIIHSAFLMMFYCFGYEYILSPEADIIRRIINENKAPWDVRKLLLTQKWVPPFSIPAAGIIRMPQKIRSFIVLLPQPENAEYIRLVFFPGFGRKGAKSFDYLMKLRNGDARRTIDVKVRVTSEGPCPYGFFEALWNDKLPDSDKNAFC